MAMVLDLPKKGVVWVAAGVAAVLLLRVLSPVTVINPGQRGVVSRLGKIQDDVLNEGPHLVWPVIDTVHKVNVQIQKGEGSGDAASRDLQSVHTSVALNYHLNPAAVGTIYREIGNAEAVGERIIVPAVQEAVKAATAMYTAEELITRRAEVRDRIRALLDSRLNRHGILVDEFSIVNFQFSKTFNDAIEAKTTAEQLKLKAERDLQRIRIEAEQKVASAKAEAESLALQKQQVSAELIRLREVENQKEAIRKWNGQLPQTMTGTAMPFIKVQ